ncbi:alpha/beta fold hydrolase [Gordonia rhizosphera]|uniref:Putative hydrolase n=1 Tax=Gordonia rhizosphera NBRC 16068 TaxID=1108045 RepID=K6WAX2_9ACTN|nr:alpha/beta hydrolase [Gordonia rhizosphera]GAB90901.1 putative hydrolase [Gordonia rhizosphera NBRC 16068]
MRAGREPPGRIVEVDGLRLHVVEDGAGPPLVLLAALGSNWFDLDPLVARLRGSWRVIRYDRPGYGFSERPGQAFIPTLDAEVERIRAVIDELGVAERVTVAAHSMASLYAEAFARRYPDRIAGVVMLDGSYVMLPWRIVPTTLRVANANRLIAAAEALTGRLGVRRWGGGSFRTRVLPGPPEGFDDDQRRWAATLFGQPSMMLATLVENAAFPAMNADLRALRAAYPMPSAPCVVVAAVSGPRLWRGFWLWKQSRYAQMLGARLEVVAPARHFLVLDRPDAVARVIDELHPPLRPHAATDH